MEQPSERKRYSPTERAELLERFDEASVSAKAFARSEGIKYPTFMYWLKARKRKARSQGFIEIAHEPALRAEQGIEIFAGNVALRVFDPKLAATLARELSATC